MDDSRTASIALILLFIMAMVCACLADIPLALVSKKGTEAQAPESPPEVAGVYPDLNLTEPTNGYPVAFSAYSPPVDEGVYSTAVVAEWTRSADNGESVVYTTEQSVTGLVVYASGSTNSVTPDAYSGYGRATMPADGFKMVWPLYGSSTGAPVRVNGTIAWWGGPDVRDQNEEFSIYGDNLQSGGTGYAWIDGYGWITNSGGNEFCSTFTVPADLPNGTYDVWAHNGKGQRFGWADKAVSITIADPVDYTTGTQTVASVSEAQLKSAISAASPGQTVIIGAGTYSLTSVLDINTGDIKLLGDGIGSTIIKVDGAWSGSTPLVDVDADGVWIEGITFDAGTTDEACNYLLDFNGGGVVQNCRFTQQDTGDGWMSHSLKLYGSDGDPLFFRTNDVVQAEIMEVYNYVEYHSNTNRGRHETSKLVQVKGNNCSFSGNHGMHYNEAVADDCGAARFFVGQGNTVYHVYIADNTTTNLKVHASNMANSGEQILFENTYAAHIGTASSGTSNTLTAAYFGTNSVSGYAITLVDGTGFGQTRPISSIDTGSSTATVIENWTIAPDNTTKFCVHKTGWRGAIVNNYLDGVKSTRNTASAAVSFYGGPSEFIVSGNTANQIEDGFIVWEFADDASLALGPGFDPPSLINPAYFNLFDDNVVQDPSVHPGTSFGEGGLAFTIQGVASLKDDCVVADLADVLGTVFRDGTFANCYRPLYISNDQSHETNAVPLNFDTYMTVFEDISGTTTNLYWVDSGVNTYTNNLSITEL